MPHPEERTFLPLLPHSRDGKGRVNNRREDGEKDQGKKLKAEQGS